MSCSKGFGRSDILLERITTASDHEEKPKEPSSAVQCVETIFSIAPQIEHEYFRTILLNRILWKPWLSHQGWWTGPG